MIKQWWNQIALKPELLFLLFAIPYGLILIFMVPPLGGSDEGFHFHRIASIGYNELLNKPVMVPAGIPAFLQAGIDFYDPVTEPPYNYSHSEWQKVWNIPLNADHKVSMEPLPVTIHHPFSYLPQLVAFVAAAATGLSPVIMLYACRLAGFISGVYLTWLAIKLMPSGKYILCALALLPTMTFYRSYANADPFTNALAFVLIALMLREIARKGKITGKAVLTLAATSFVLAQAKNAYLLLPFLALAIPAGRFLSLRSRVASLALITLPGALASIAWMVLIKQTYFAGGINYQTWGGNVNPAMQMQFLLAHPLQYPHILFNTFFLTLAIPNTVATIFNSLGLGYPVPLSCVIVLLLCFIRIIYNDRGTPIHYGQTVRLLGAGIFLGSTLITLTILYIQWTGLQADAIQGFQGRYLYPVLPFIVLFIEPSAQPPDQRRTASYIAILAILGLSISTIRVWFNYY